MSRPPRAILYFLPGLAAAGTIALLWGTELPLGVPGEWTWARIRVADDAMINAVLGWLMAGLVGAGYLCLAWLGARRIEVASPRERAAWLAALAAGGFAWLCAAQESPAPFENQWGKAAWVIYYRGPDGYFDEARYGMTDVDSFLAGYEERMREGDVLHFGTHPPGLVLFHRATIALCEGLPGLTRLMLATQPASVVETFNTIELNERSGPKALQMTDRGAIWLGVLIVQAIAAATVAPLYWLARRTASPSAAWQAVSFWPLVPALAVFLPKSDALFPFLGTAFLALWLAGWNRRSPLLCLAAGGTMWLGMFLSLALLPVALLGVLITVAEAWLGSPGETPTTNVRTRAASAAVCAGWTMAGFAVPIVLLWLIWDANLIRIWMWNYDNHAGFYDNYTRTYWKWLLVNPLELALGLGAPVAVMAAAAWIRLRPWNECNVRLAHAAACFAVWAALWISGKNMGEAARLWLVVMPWPVWVLSSLFDQPRADGAASVANDAADSGSGSLWLWALVAQGIVCAATVSRVNGFDFGINMAPPPGTL